MTIYIWVILVVLFLLWLSYVMIIISIIKGLEDRSVKSMNDSHTCWKKIIYVAIKPNVSSWYNLIIELTLIFSWQWILFS